MTADHEAVLRKAWRTYLRGQDAYREAGEAIAALRQEGRPISLITKITGLKREQIRRIAMVHGYVAPEEQRRKGLRQHDAD